MNIIMEEEKTAGSEPNTTGEKETHQASNEGSQILNMQELLNEIELLSKSDHITSTHKQFKKILSKWEKLASDSESIESDLLESFQTIQEQYKKNYDWALWANYKIKEEICLELEDILEKEEKSQLIDKFEILRNKWKVTGNIPPEKNQELWERYKELGKKIHYKTLDFFQKNLDKKNALCEKIEGMTNVDNWQTATEFVKEAQKNWNQMGLVQHKDSEEIWKRFQSACNAFFNSQKNHYKEIKKQQKINLQQKRELCEQVESFTESSHWKETSIKIHEIQKKWKAIGTAGKKHETTVWKRFKTACDTFFTKQKEYFAQIEKERPVNLQKKEELCEKLEKMETLEDNEKYKLILDCQNEWKKIGPVPKDNEKKLWQRFRKPIDAYFNSRKQKYEAEKEHYSENLKKKEELCQKAEKLQNSDDWQETKEKLKEMQKEWNAIGNVPRTKEREVWHQFKKACDTFFERLKEHRDEIKHELQDNLHKKIDLCFQAEIIAGIEVSPENSEERAKWQLEKLSENFWYKIIEDESWDAKKKKIKELQKIWKQIGPVPKNRSQEIWDRFQKACNWFFENKRSHSRSE